MIRIASRATPAIAAFVLATLMSATAGASPFNVVVSVSGPAIAGPAAIGDYDVVLSFDPTSIVQSVAFGTQLSLGDPAGSFRLEDATAPGVLEVLEVSFQDPVVLMDDQSDAFALFTVLFDSGPVAPATAFASMQIVSALFGDSIGDPLDAVRVRLEFREVGDVPEPGSMLMGAGLLGAMVMARRRRAFNR